MAHEPSLVARRIREIRERERLTRQELADRLGTTRIQVWRIEKGVTAVSAEAAADFAQALGVSVASLYRESKAAS
jgi:transcriptional regulator with XRE-family HTH domain